MKKCEECTECCSVLPIQEIQKHAGKECPNCILSAGCSIYRDRPKSCVDFNCNYLDEGMPLELRPDKIGIIFERITPTIMLGTRDFKRMNSWNDPQVFNYIKDLLDYGTSVILTSFSTAPKLYFIVDGRTQEEVLKEAMEEYNKTIL